MNEDPLVSILCLVYNHGPYLRQCLDSIVTQKTIFKFEAFVHDDASTDDSASIILEYANNYPDIIKPFFEKENLYSKKDRSFERMVYNPDYLTGKYIALCEGDDYWTDPLKLQKQVDYMEMHPECSMCFGNAIEHWEDGRWPDRPCSSLANQEYDGEYLCWNWRVPTASYLFRGDIIKSQTFLRFVSNRKMIVGDLPLFLTCANNGSLFAFSDIFSVYRKHSGSFTMSMDPSVRKSLGEMWEEIPVVFGKKYTDVSFFHAVYHYRSGLRSARMNGDKTMQRLIIRRIFKLYTLHPKSGIRRIMRITRERL